MCSNLRNTLEADYNEGIISYRQLEMGFGHDQRNKQETARRFIKDIMHLYGMTGIHSSCTTIQRDRWRDFDKLKEATFMYNMGRWRAQTTT